MEEAERLADRIVIMDHGRVLANDTLSGLRARMAPGADGKTRLAEAGGEGGASLETLFLTLTGRNLRD